MDFIESMAQKDLYDFLMMKDEAVNTQGEEV